MWEGNERWKRSGRVDIPQPWGYEPPAKTTTTYQSNQLIDGVWSPALKSIFLGFTLGVLVGLLTWSFRWSFSPWLAWLITWFAVMPFTFWRYTERAAWMIERITGADLNGDGYIGEPEPVADPQPVRVVVEQDQGRIVDYIDLPKTVTADKAAIFASGLLGGRALTQGAWVGSGGLFSRSEYDAMINELILRGLAAWRNPEAHAQGLELTAAGRGVMRRLADNTPTLPSGEEASGRK